MSRKKHNKMKLSQKKRQSMEAFNKVIENKIPKGNSREDIKARKQIIGDFYATWIAEHPDKIIWNESLNDYIHVKYQSINETKGQASISYESTCAVLNLTEVLEKAVVIKRKESKTNDKNQKAYDQMIIMSHKGTRLLVGHQSSTNEYVQYCITTKKSAWDADLRARIK